MRKPLWILFLLALLGSVPVQADPGYGLVLSGGAARGLAHIGVLKALEEQGIRPVAVVGTSMGALVGGFYAVGYNADQIEDIARTMAWNDVFVDYSKRSQRPYELRQIDADLMVSYKLTINEGRLATPRGLLQGQRLQLELDRILSQGRQAKQFDHLAIPFRAVATDLTSGEAVALEDGSLSRALRATMSIPGLLEPVNYGGTLLVDGGIANNLPVNVARTLPGVNRIIAVDVGTPLQRAEDIRSFGSVIAQFTGLSVRNNALEQISHLNAQDILVQPALDTVQNIHFDKLDDSIDAGYHATRQALLAKNLWRETAHPTPPPLADNHDRVVQRIRIENDSILADRVIRNLIQQPERQPLDNRLLRENIDSLYALDFFSSVRYRLEGDREDTTLVIEANRKQWGHSWVRLGLEASDDFRGENRANLHASTFVSGFNPRGAHFYARTALGSEPALYGHFYQPLDDRLGWYLKPYASIQTLRIPEIDLSVSDNPYGRSQQVEREGGLVIGRNFWQQKGTVFAGATRGDGHLKARIGQPQRVGRYDYGYYQVGLGVDTLDNLAFPTQGFALNYRYQFHREELGSEQNYARSKGSASVVKSNRRVSWLLEGDWSRTFHTGAADLVRQEYLGGFLELSGLPQGSYSGQQRVLGRALVQVRLKKPPVLPLGVPVYLGLSAERGLVFDSSRELSWNNSIESGSVFVGADTFLGPVYLAYGRAEGGHEAVSFSLGRRFR